MVKYYSQYLSTEQSLVSASMIAMQLCVYDDSQGLSIAQVRKMVLSLVYYWSFCNINIRIIKPVVIFLYIVVYYNRVIFKEIKIK